MSRWKASGIHLSISVIIALAVAAVMLFLWYPSPYFQSLGGKKLILIIIGVDVVVGPLLTWIIFKPNKKGLKFDLSVIAVIQLVALTYGVNVLYQERPVFVVFVKDRFEIIAASDVDKDSLKNVTFDEFKSLSLTGPEIAAAQIPKDPMERERMLFSAIDKGRDIQSYPEHFVPYQEQTDAVLKRSQPISLLRKFRPESTPLISQTVERLNTTEEDLLFLPMRTQRGGDLTAVISPSNGSLVDILQVDPWID